MHSIVIRQVKMFKINSSICFKKLNYLIFDVMLEPNALEFYQYYHIKAMCV